MPHLEITAYIEKEKGALSQEEADQLIFDLVDWMEKRGLLMNSVSKYHKDGDGEDPSLD